MLFQPSVEISRHENPVVCYSLFLLLLPGRTYCLWIHQRVIITRTRTMAKLHATSTMYSRRRRIRRRRRPRLRPRRNSVGYSPVSYRKLQNARRASLSHVQTRVINSATHLRIHTAELRGLRDNEISRANYTRGGRVSLLATELARQSLTDFRQRRNSKE